MEPRFLLDTNICIHIRQEKPKQSCDGSAGSAQAKPRFRSSLMEN